MFLNQNISFKKNRELYFALLGLLPALTLFSIFILYPLAMNLVYAFTNYDGFSREYDFVGFKNFVKYFTSDRKSLKAFGNTLVYSFFSILIGTILQLSATLAFYRKVKFSSFFKAVFYVPAVISIVILSIAWRNILQFRGLLNRVLESVGWDFLMFDWLGSADMALGSLIFITSWMSVGYGAIILLVGLNSIPMEIMEAAEIDGASGFKKFIYITLPLMMYSITVLMFIGLTGTLKQFALPFIMTNGGPIDSTLTVTMNIYNNAFQYNKFGYAAASAIIFTLFIGIVTLAQLKLTRSREVQY